VKIGEAAFLAVTVGIAGAGLLATARAGGQRPLRPAPARWAVITAGLRAGLGRVGAFYAIVIASVFPLILLVWPLGSWSRHKPLTSLNNKVLHDYYSGLNHTLTSAMKVLTQMGNWYQIVSVALVGSALLAFFSKTKRWLPPLVILTTLLGERYLQKAITAICKVQHPPTDLGTYPSGGVARLVCIYGIVGFMALRVFAPRSRRAMVGGLWLLGLLTWIEAYSRIHLQKHWFFDPIGGFLLGAGILAVAVIASNQLPWPALAAPKAAEKADSARHRGGRRRRERTPLWLRVGQGADADEVVLDGIADNGDPARPEPELAAVEPDGVELDRVHPAGAAEPALSARTAEPAPVVDLRRSTRLANGAPKTPKQPTAERVDDDARRDAARRTDEPAAQTQAEPAADAAGPEADLATSGPVTKRRRRSPKA
jgi:hypothetical protein